MKIYYNSSMGMSAPWKDLRLSRCLSLRRLSEKTGIPKSSLSRYEKFNYIPDFQRYSLLIDFYSKCF